jgi:hypothetical protein
MTRAVLVFLVLCATLAAPDPVLAFWPFTRNSLARPDSVAAEEWDRRFDAWKERPAVGDSAAAAPDRPAARPTSSRKVVTRGRDVLSGDVPPGMTAADISRLAQQAGKKSGSAAADSFAAAWGDSAQADSLGASAAGADSAQGSGDTQTTQAAAPDSGFTPSFLGKLSSSNDNMAFNSSLTIRFLDASKTNLTSTLTYGDDISLTQNTEKISRSIRNLFTLPIQRHGLFFELATGNNRNNLSGGRTVNNTRSNTLTEGRTATVKAGISRRILPGLGGNASYARDFSRNEQDVSSTFGTSSGSRNSQVTGNSIGVGLDVDPAEWVTIRGRYGKVDTNNLDQSPSFITETNPLGEEETTSAGDSASVNVSFTVGAWIPTLGMGFSVIRGERSYADYTSTSTGGTGSATDFTLETETRFTRQLQVNTSLRPWSGLGFDLSLQAARDSTAYAVKPNSFDDTQRLRFTLLTNLTYMKDCTVAINFETGRADVNRDEPSNPRNPQSREDKENRITADINHTFSPTFKVHAYTEFRLNQGFYRHPGPQGLGDRDELRTRLGIDVSGKINSKMTASATLYVRTFDQAFIDPRRSASSRDETEYVVRQDFRYQVTKNVSLSQLYGLSSKVLDEIYDPTRNTLNRNHFLQTGWNYNVTDRLALDGDFDYSLQDNGAYVRDPFSQSEERFFSPTVETKKNGFAVGLKYQLLSNGRLTFTSRQESSREWRSAFSRGEKTSETINDRGNMALGITSVLQVGGLRLDTRATRNQSSNVTLNRNVFYNVESTLTYTF